MKKEDLFEAVGNIDDKKIERAWKRTENSSGKSSRIGVRVALIAACFAVFAAITAISVMKEEKEPVIPQGDIVSGTIVTDGQKVGEESSKQGNVHTYTAEKNKLVFNDSEEFFEMYPVVLSLPADYVKYENYSEKKIPQDIWENIMTEFETMTGFRYENFLMELPGGLEHTGFHTVSLREYKNPDREKDIYTLSDFIFEYSNGKGGEIAVAVGGKTTPFTGSIMPSFIGEDKKLKKSAVNGTEMTIIKYYNDFDVRFEKDGIGYFISFCGCDEIQLEEFLSWITILKKGTNEAQADADGFYAEAVTPDMLTEDTEDVFCGAYIDGDGNYTVLLTEVNDENIDLVSKVLGIDKKTTAFKEAKYTLSYLTELQKKISEKMMSGELNFVVGSGVYEDENRIVVGVLDRASDQDKEKILELDTLGGAIEFEITQPTPTLLDAIKE